MTNEHSTKRIQHARGWCATVKRDCANCINLILPLWRPRPPVFWGKPASWLAERQLLAGDIESNPGPKPTLKKPLHTLTPPHSLNTLIHQSNPLNPTQPTHRIPHPHLSNHICPLCKTNPHTAEHLFNCTHLYTSNNILYLWMSPGRVVRASASRLERTPGRATLTYWVVGPLHSYTQEGLVDNNNNERT